jgi:hypothetical protein
MEANLWSHIREQTLTEDYPNQLASQYAPARAYRTNGEVAEAVFTAKAGGEDPRADTMKRIIPSAAYRFLRSCLCQKQSRLN